MSRTARFNWHELEEPPRPPPEEVIGDIAVDEDGGRFDFDQAPWTRAVCKWWTDSDVRTIWLIQGSQTCKTTIMMLLGLYAAKHDPGPGMWIGAVEDEVGKFVLQRFKPFLEAADPSTRTKRKSDWRTTDLRIFGRMLMHFAWATSGRRLRSWPCRYIFGDECGIWPVTLPNIGDVLQYIKKRQRRFKKKKKAIFGTTPASALHPTWKAAIASNFYRWHVPCPHCGHLQYLSFDRVKFGHCRDEHGEWVKERILQQAFYECEKCHDRCTERDKTWMINRGELACVDPDTGEAREHDIGNDSVALQVPATYSLYTTWGELAVMFLDAKEAGPEALKVFVTDELAEPSREAVDVPTASAIEEAIDHERAAGTVPDNVLAITAGVDVQKNRMYWTVRGWGPGERSYQTAHGVLPRGSEDEPLDILAEVLCTDYQGKAIAFTFIDSGYKPELVYAFCRKYGRRIAPSKGASTDIAELVSPRKLEKHDGKPVPGGLTLHLVNSGYFKAAIHDRLAVPRGSPREWRLHGDVDRNFREQILAEARTERVERGRLVEKWVVINKKAGNHFLDVEALAMAAAWYPVGVQRLKPKPPSPPRTGDDEDRPPARPNIRRQYE